MELFHGAFALDDTIVVLAGATGGTIVFWDGSFNRQSSNDFTLNSATSEYRGVTLSPTRVIVLNSTFDRLEFYGYDGTYYPTENISLGTGTFLGVIRTSDRYIVSQYVSSSIARLRFWTFAGSEEASETITLPVGGFHSALALSDTRFFSIRVSTGYAYDFDRNRQSSDDLTGLSFISTPTASFTTFEQSATLTISTTDTDIRVGEAVDINIASDIDIEDFVASDIAVTGGTRGALTENSATSYTLRVTAGSAGTLTVSIAEDAVTPGNVLASEDFTVNARATATIAFDDASGESGGSTGVNIAFGESVSGLQLAHLSASSGTLSNLTGSGTSWEADLDFPATGMGTVTVTLAEDATSPQNAEAEASIDYQEPLETRLDRADCPSRQHLPSHADI